MHASWDNSFRVPLESEKISLQATQPKLLVIGAELRAARATQTAERFNELANAVLRVELPPDFSRVDAGRAADHLLAEVRAVMGDGGSRVTGV